MPLTIMLPLISVALFVVSYGNPSTTTVPSGVYGTTTQPTVMEFASTTFAGTPLLAITKCESGNRHFATDGSVLRGLVNSDDIGFAQINLYYHKEEADRLNLNLFDPYDNIRFARWLYDREGAQPWSASSKCWKPMVDS